jgi:hypothetical protein
MLQYAEQYLTWIVAHHATVLLFIIGCWELPKYSAQFDGDLVSASMKKVRIAVSAVNRCENIRK